MRFLRICQYVPYPVRDGGAAEPFYLTQRLAQAGHQTTLVAFVSEPAADTSPLEQWCELHKIPYSGRNTLLDMARGVLERFPVNYVKYRDARLLAKCLQLLQRGSYDAVIVDLSAMGWYALYIKKHCNIPVITRWQNLDTLIWERWIGSQGNLLKRVLGRYQLGLVRNFERQLALGSDLCLTMGARDTTLLQKLAPGARVKLLPLGVDVQHYAPTLDVREPTSILFLASGYRWHANLDAVQWLYQSIMPRIWSHMPQVKLYITGADTTGEMNKWTKNQRVVLTGFVPDERTIISKASVIVVPMRLGGGIKLKILTAFASGRAVVTTSPGAEGIPDLTDGEELLVRDTADHFADAVIELIENQELRRKIEENGRAFACRHYDWGVLADQWEQTLASVTKPVVREQSASAIR